MKFEILREGQTAVLLLRDQLTVNDRASFENVVSELVDQNPARIRVDLPGLDFMDSAGLGCLLTLRDRAGGSRRQVILAGAKGAVKELLELARFDILFAMA